MTVLRHEIWRDAEGLTGMCLAGPMGDAFRALQGPGSELVCTIDASSHAEAMTMYYERMAWGAYTTDFECDNAPYPEAWLVAQGGAVSEGKVG